MRTHTAFRTFRAEKSCGSRWVSLVAAVGLVAALAAPAMADLAVDASGNVTDWGITPFTHSNVTNALLGNMVYTIADDYAPIDYPSGVGHVPSPGGSLGEAFDLEEMYMRVSGNSLQVLVVTSSAYTRTVDGTAITLGDLFLDLGGSRFAVVTQSASQGLTAGGVYQIASDSDVKVLQPAGSSRSYYGTTYTRPNDYGPDATIGQIAGPWAVASTIDAGQQIGQADIATALFNYGGDENGTFLIEYSLDLGLFGGMLPGSTAGAHIAWGCGNDVIKTQTSTIPEPATMALLGFGLAAIVLRRKR
ncbi:MAG TPA: PEP-CTERM sorting domain-containing protein [Phycisphaerae bacterium]|nr:PEP-CTERM sorting domain-containing protein [Phycisphaerae bacterium]HOI53889.1 PEP-CTERM sorting domain-containing protein [Phycisphaerae bacterium]